MYIACTKTNISGYRLRDRLTQTYLLLEAKKNQTKYPAKQSTLLFFANKSQNSLAAICKSISFGFIPFIYLDMYTNMEAKLNPGYFGFSQELQEAGLCQQNTQCIRDFLFMRKLQGNPESGENSRNRLFYRICNTTKGYC